MGTLKDKTKQELEHLTAELTKVRDQLKLELHLASMEVKSRYEKIEPEIFELEQKAKRATEETAREVKDKLRDLRTRLHDLRERRSS